jgi:hypothetical protein
MGSGTESGARGSAVNTAARIDVVVAQSQPHPAAALNRLIYRPGLRPGSAIGLATGAADFDSVGVKEV